MPNNQLTQIAQLEARVRELEGLLSQERTTVAQLHEEMIALRRQYSETIDALEARVRTLLLTGSS